MRRSPPQLRAEASLEKAGEGSLPPEILCAIVTLSEARKFFQVVTTKKNTNNPPLPQQQEFWKKQLLPLWDGGKNKVRPWEDLI